MIPGVMAPLGPEAMRAPARAVAAPALIASAAAGAGAVVVAAAIVRASGAMRIATKRSVSIPRRMAMKPTWPRLSQRIPRADLP
jgi:hypothetical protein